MKSIMPASELYETERFAGSHKHHVFGASNRNKSEEYGLYIYLTPEMHNMSDRGIHFDKGFDRYVKRLAQKTAMQYYGWNMEDWRERFGRNYL